MKWPQAFILSLIIVFGFSCREVIVKSKKSQPKNDGKPGKEQQFNKPTTRDTILTKPKKPLKRSKKNKPLDTLRPRVALFKETHLEQTEKTTSNIDSFFNNYFS
ncbi:hypothetical protein [Maribacter sp. 2304DJ31-5]|uniref:hypothetical protein n=1 Tax=Maribacter sp. 2304DJ31-5 TaxID=3386273 RepID=UPI0039BD6BA1